MPKKKFKEDWRKENPGLHLLYTKWAVKHLCLIDDCIKRLSIANCNLNGALMSLYKERAKLVKNNAAYAEAQEILEEVLPILTNLKEK